MKAKMKQLLLPLLGMSLLLLNACSDPQEAPTAAQNEVDVHGEGWRDPTSPNFHGKVLAAQSYDAKSCRPCHGSQFDGGLAESSCRKCHVTYPHPPGWVNASSPNFHGETLAGVNYNLNLCNSCHGNQFDGGTSGVSCRSCHATYPHLAGWVNPTAAEFHGKALAAQNYDATACQACHGAQYDGGTSGVSCKGCHATYPHPQGWVNASSPSFHGETLAGTNYDLNLCSSCHGSQFDGGTSGVSCRTCHATYPHLADWMNPAAAAFHGKALAAQNYDATACQACHGAQYDGGSSGVSCKGCHASYPHPQNWIAGAASHYTFLKSNSYDLNSCQICHGQDYALVKVNNSCLTCHTQQNGPEACNTCHGNPAASAADLKNSAPPKGLDDETEATSPAVGAHQAHLGYFTQLTTAAVCQECHAVPTSFALPNHIDDNTRAEAVFVGPLGARQTEGGARVPQVVYDFNTNTCSNSYCHGNWALRKAQSPNDFGFAAEVMTGSNAAPSWVNSGSAPCGSCHGLPPTGHTPFALTACTICHQGVVDGFGNITDRTKHINGKVNVLGLEYDMY